MKPTRRLRARLALAALSIPVLLVGVSSCTTSSEPAVDASPNLVREQTRFLDGLEETVTLVKSPETTYAIRADGRIESIEAVLASDRAAWIGRHGKMPAPTVARLAQVAEGEVVPLAIVFDGGLDWHAHGTRLRSKDHLERSRARTDIEAAIRKSAALAHPEWKAAGFTITESSEQLPIVYGRATASDAKKLARLPSVAWVLSDERVATKLLSAPNAISDPQTDTTFNAQGFFGDGQNVGVFEASSCGIYDKHEAFSNAAGIIYSSAVPSCMADSECVAICGDLGACVDGRCIETHQSSVTSCMVATKSGQRWGAANAQIFDFNAQQTSCVTGGVDHGYNWFDKNDVTTVPESWFCCSLGHDGMVQDHYIRAAGISVFKAAGNQEGCKHESIPDQVACAETLNSVCVGGATGGGTSMASFSSWVNPPKTDREEPDVVALASGVEVSDTGAPDDWQSENGTSFATPAVAGIAALMKQACKKNGQDIDREPLVIRALLQVSGWFRNPADWKYSTPNGNMDHVDGAGGVVAGIALAACGVPTGTGPHVGWHQQDIDLTGGGPLPGGKPPVIGLGPPGEKPLSHNAPGGNDGRVGITLTSFPGLRRDQRLRVTFVWNSCPATVYASATPPSAVATDFDVFLFNKTTKTYAYASQSVDDNSEGFDVRLPAGGDYDVILGWPKGNTGCGSTSEPIAWAFGLQ
jgi:hypothetical protein